MGPTETAQGPASLVGWVVRALRWLVIICFGVLAAEFGYNTLCSHWNYPNGFDNRQRCRECRHYVGEVESQFREQVDHELVQLVQTRSAAELAEVAANPSVFFTEARRKAVGKTVMNTACRGQPNPQTCVAALARRKAALLKALITADALLLVRTRRAIAAAVPGFDAGVTPAQELEASRSQARLICSPDCEQTMFFDFLFPPAIWMDPSLEPFVSLVAELWGAIVIVLLVGGLLTLTLQTRSAAANRQHELYVRLVTRFKSRVTPAGAAAAAAAPAAAVAAKSKHPAAPATHHAKTVAKGT